MAQSPACEAPDLHTIDRLHQVLIVDQSEGQLHLPPAISQTSEQFRSMYPSASYTLWTKEVVREFIRHHVDSAVLHAFDQLIPNTYKSDLARYCLLYELGGFYSDLGIEHYSVWNIPKHHDIAGFLESGRYRRHKYDVTNGVLWSSPRSPTLHGAIERVLENCRGRHLGNKSIDPTGPSLLGRAWVSVHMDRWRKGLAVTQYLGLTEHIERYNTTEMRFWPMEKDGQSIARRLPRKPGDARYLGIDEKSYIQMWRDGTVYAI